MDPLFGHRHVRDEVGSGESTLVRRLTSELESALTELAHMRARLVVLEATVDEDPLVPVFNRRGFMRELDRGISYVSRYRRLASVIYIDLDGMKSVNDRHGHAAGDRILVAFGHLLMDHVRRSDAIGRLGGDEFAIFLHEADRATAEAKARELTNLALDLQFDFEAEPWGVAFSWGVAEIVAEEPATAALARADAEMYRAKERHKAALRDRRAVQPQAMMSGSS